MARRLGASTLEKTAVHAWTIRHSQPFALNAAGRGVDPTWKHSVDGEKRGNRSDDDQLFDALIPFIRWFRGARTQSEMCASDSIAYACTARKAETVQL